MGAGRSSVNCYAKIMAGRPSDRIPGSGSGARPDRSRHPIDCCLPDRALLPYRKRVHRHRACCRWTTKSRGVVSIHHPRVRRRSTAQARLRLVRAQPPHDLLQDRLLRSPPQERLLRPVTPLSDPARAHRHVLKNTSSGGDC